MSLKGFVKFVLRVAITAFVAGACGAGAWLYYATHYLHEPAKQHDLPTPQVERGDPYRMEKGDIPSAVNGEVGGGMGLIESIVGKVEPGQGRISEGPTVPAYITTETPAYLEEGKGLWGRLPKKTVVYTPDGGSSASWAKVYYPQKQGNLVLYVSIRDVKKGVLEEPKPVPVPQEQTSPENLAESGGKESPSSTAACQNANISSGSMLKGAPRGENRIVVFSRDKDAVVQAQSLTEGFSMYVGAGRTETLRVPSGFYAVSFLMGRQYTECGTFLEGQEAKRDKTGADFSQEGGAKTIRYDMSSGTEGGDFITLPLGDMN